jgi:hypothetical protein
MVAHGWRQEADYMNPQTPQLFDQDAPPPLPTCIGVTVRTPAGSSSAFAVERDDSAGVLTNRAVDHFVARDLLAHASYRLGLARADAIVYLTPDANLMREGVVEGDVLHLLITDRQLDPFG